VGGIVLDKIIRRIRGPRKYILYLARRGRPLVIDEIIAYSIDEAKEEAEAIIDSLNPEEIPDLRKYRYFILKSEDGREARRIRNPFAQEGEKEITLRDFEQLTMATLLESLPQLISQNIQLVTTLNQQLMTSILNSYLQALGLKERDKSEQILETIQRVAEAVIAEKAREKSEKPAARRPRILPRELLKRLEAGEGEQ